MFEKMEMKNMQRNKNLRGKSYVCVSLGTYHLVEIENFLLKVL